MDDDFPNWDLSIEYLSLDSKELEADFQEVEVGLDKVEIDIQPINLFLEGEKTSDIIDLCQDLALRKTRFDCLGYNLLFYCNGHKRVDTSDPDAKKASNRSHEVLNRIDSVYIPLFKFIEHCSDEMFEKFLGEDELGGFRFYYSEMRKYGKRNVSYKEVQAMAKLENTGYQSWSEYHQETVSGLSWDLNLKEEELWNAEANAFAPHLPGLTTCLNALAGWRNATDDLLYGKNAPKMSLESALQRNRVTRKTVESLMDLHHKRMDISIKAQWKIYKYIGIEKPDPWTGHGKIVTKALFRKYTFKEMIHIIREAYGTIHPEMADFVTKMVEQKNLQIKRNPNINPIGGMFRFYKSGTPRCILPYRDGWSYLTSLAHELGHAFQYWCQRDLPVWQEMHPASIAESSSIFAEEVIKNYMREKAEAENDEDLLQSMIISDVGDAVRIGFISIRYDFEQEVYKRRRERLLTTDEICDLWGELSSKYYGIPKENTPRHQWAQNFHFFRTDLKFYNFPYSFGWLWALGVKRIWEKDKQNFFPHFKEMLHNAGKMTAEDLAIKYLDVDISGPDFWNQGFNTIEARVDTFQP